MIKKLLLLTVCLYVFSDARAQSVREIENRIFKYLSAIEKWDTTSFSEDENIYDSLANTNKALLDYLNRVLVKNKATLQYDFKKLKGSQLQILTSDDKKFRIYCWYLGGSAAARSYDVVIQYEGLNGSQVKIINDESNEQEGDVCSGYFYHDLFTIQTKTGKKVYVTMGGSKVAMGLYGYEVHAFTIESGKLNDSVKIFKTQTKELNSISFACDLAGTVNKKCPEFKMSSNKQKLYVPIIKENDKITDKYLVYKWDGNNYVFDKKLK